MRGKGKAIIDFMPVVEDLQKVDTISDKFEKIGMNILESLALPADGIYAKAEMNGRIKYTFLRQTIHGK